MKFQYDHPGKSPQLFYLSNIVPTLAWNVFIIIASVYTILGLPTAYLRAGCSNLFGLLFLLFVTIGGDFITFSRLLLVSDIELTHEQVILCLLSQWHIKLKRSELNDMAIRQYTRPETRIFDRLLGAKMELFYISSPDLPWYFQMVGRFAHKSFKGRGFFITSRHTNYELFLEQMRRYEEF